MLKNILKYGKMVIEIDVKIFGRLNRMKNGNIMIKIILLVAISTLLSGCNVENVGVAENTYDENTDIVYKEESHEPVFVNNYEKALEFGRAKLIEKYPDIISEQDEVIGYKFNGVWHVQNFVKHTSDNPYEYSNDYGYVFNNLETTKYIKFMDNDFSEILMYGEFDLKEEVELLDIYTVGGFLNAGEIANQIITNKYRADYNKVYYNQMSGGMWMLYVLPDVSDIEKGQVVLHSAEGVINIRDNDGMILFFNYE